MNTGEALKVLVKAGYLTAEDAKDIETKANNKRIARISTAREVAKRAMADYFVTLMPDIDYDEHMKFVRTVFDELEKGLEIPLKKEVKKDPDPDDEIKKFLKSLGVA